MKKIITGFLASAFLALSICQAQNVPARNPSAKTALESGQTAVQQQYFPKKGVVVLGYNTSEPNWDETIWGFPPDRPGRVVKAAAVILSENPGIAIISGGLGQREGKSEAWWARQRLYDGLADLKKFTIYPVFQRFQPDEVKERLDKVLKLEEKARNTAENIINTGPLLKEAGVEEIIIVTSPDHISRGLRDALQYWGKDYPGFAANIYGTPSVTFYSEKTPEDRATAKMENVVIAEPPAAKKINLGRIFGVMGSSQALSELDAVLKKYGK